jgi:hypothetical protein
MLSSAQIKLPAMFDSLKKKKGDAASVADEKDKKSGEWGFNNPFGGDEGDSGETPTCDDGVKNQNEDEIDCCLTPAQKKKQGGSFFRRMQASTRRALTGMHSSGAPQSEPNVLLPLHSDKRDAAA